MLITQNLSLTIIVIAQLLKIINPLFQILLNHLNTKRWTKNSLNQLAVTISSQIWIPTTIRNLKFSSVNIQDLRDVCTSFLVTFHGMLFVYRGGGCW